MDEQASRAGKGKEGQASGEEPYVPEYKGFDEESTARAQQTAKRAQEGASAKGMDANNSYVDDGPDEAARRTGRSRQDLSDSIENAAKRGGRKQ